MKLEMAGGVVRFLDSAETASLEMTGGVAQNDRYWARRSTEMPVSTKFLLNRAHKLCFITVSEDKCVESVLKKLIS